MVDVVISYDYELCWGVWDIVPLHYARTHVARANAAARGLVALHRKYQVPSTWAMVGAMLAESAPAALMAETARPTSQAEAFAAYVDSLAEHERGGLFRADPEVLDALDQDRSLFEPASHTFSHIYALDAASDTLVDDFARFDAVFRTRFGRKAVSLVFPKNQSTEEAVRIARRFGFNKMRVNPRNWLYEQRRRNRAEALVIRALRYLDSFLPILELLPDRKGEDPALVSGQYFFRPAFPARFLDYLHAARLRVALWYCHQQGRSCHFWSHPHNFGGDPERALANAERLLAYLKQQEAKGCVRLRLMKEQAP